MNKTVLTATAAMAIAFVVFFVLATMSGFSYYFHPLFKACTQLYAGMTREEALERMKDTLANPVYRSIPGESGHYGWLNRLVYDESLTVVLEKEPWYKLDQHPWRCELLFRNGLVVDVTAFFD